MRHARVLWQKKAAGNRAKEAERGGYAEDTDIQDALLTHPKHIG